MIFVFRPSTPIFDLLEHKYQDKWLQERRKLELAKRQEEHKVRNLDSRVYRNYLAQAYVFFSCHFYVKLTIKR